MIRGLLDRRMMPMVTLHHFTNPLWVAERGGWSNPEIVVWFERYARKVAASLGDLVGLWITINEPNVYATEGYIHGLFPPGEKNMDRAWLATRHLVEAHAAVYRAIHELLPGALVGMAHHYRGFAPARKSNPLDRFVARLRHRFFNDIAPRAAHDGILRIPLRRVRLPKARATQDFIGLNHYTVEHCEFDIRRPQELFTRGFYPEGADLSPTGFVANVPEGMWDALQWAHGFGLPIYITEHGVEDDTDRLRPRYLVSHLMQVWHAMNIHWRIQGYYHWTLVDNFEWERGWTQRFGLWSLDPETQARRKRASADLYAEICKTNALSSETVARFAPEVHEKLFPSRGSPDLGITRGV
jgi:beta-glucosidase